MEGTLISEPIGNAFRAKKIQEEHISLIEELESQYLGHFTVKTGSAKSISDGLLNYLESKEIVTNRIIAVGCDGTAVNTEPKEGAINLSKDKLNNPFHWFVCQPHANELPLCHLIDDLDGKTTGPIGKRLELYETLSVAIFNQFPTDLPSVDRNDLSTDQKYIFDIHQCISLRELLI